MLSAERLRELVSYDPETGVMRWRVNKPRSRVKAGAVVGTATGHGYLKAVIDMRKHYVHRLAWLYVKGAPAAGELDHINGNRSDNRICNLRVADRSKQLGNTCLRSSNTSGHTGVYWRAETQKWGAKIRRHGRWKYLGQYENKLDAARAYKVAAEEFFGEFASHISRRPVASPSNANGDNLQ